MANLNEKRSGIGKMKLESAQISAQGRVAADSFAHRSAGFTLVELMISMGLSSLVLAAAFSWFIYSNRVFHSSTQQSIIQQTARAALDMIVADISQAGLGVVEPRTKDITEAEMVFTTGCINSTLSPDQLQFRASLGGMMIFSDNPGQVLDNNDASSINWKMVPDPIENAASQQFDLFHIGDQVQIYTRKRLSPRGPGLDTIAIITGLTSVVPGQEPIVSLDFDPDLPGVQGESGMIMVERPLLITYSVVNGTLQRCTSWDPASPCPANTISGIDPRGTVNVVENVNDLQFSYYIKDPDPLKNEYSWVSVLPDLAARITITAVKIEILISSIAYDPVLSSGQMPVETVYKLGDATYNVPATELIDPITGARNIKARMQMSTTVWLPNMMIGQQWPKTE